MPNHDDSWNRRFDLNMDDSVSRLTSEYDRSLLAELYGESIHSPIRRVVSQVRHEVRRRVVSFPLLYLPLSRWKYPPGVLHRPEALYDNTELILEGYPRSGNTFAFTAFDIAQGDNAVRVTHHLHTSSVVIAGIKRGIPCVIFVRNPEDAIISHIIYSQNLTIRQCLSSYIDFYEPLWKFRDKFITAKFEDVISNFGSITHQVNEKFSTSFSEFEHNQQNVNQCFSILENSWKDLGLNQKKSVTNAPSQKRRQYKEILKNHFRANDISRLRQRAIDIYNEYI